MLLANFEGSFITYQLNNIEVSLLYWMGSTIAEAANDVVQQTFDLSETRLLLSPQQPFASRRLFNSARDFRRRRRRCRLHSKARVCVCEQAISS